MREKRKGQTDDGGRERAEEETSWRMKLFRTFIDLLIATCHDYSCWLHAGYMRHWRIAWELRGGHCA